VNTDTFIRSFVASWEQRDSAAVLACFADDGLYHANSLPPIVGRAALTEWVRSFESKPPGQLQIVNQVASPSVVMQERVDDITINGKPITLPICAVFEIAAGKITAWREYFDLGVAAAAYVTDDDR
jgi:limonene-1,2-epoxide hydrolase